MRGALFASRFYSVSGGGSGKHEIPYPSLAVMLWTHSVCVATAAVVCC